MQSQYRRRGHRLCDVDEVPHGVVAEIFVRGHVGGIGDGAQQQGVAIGRAAGHKFGGNVAASPCAVFYNHGLPQCFLQLDGYAPRHDIGGTTGCVTHNQTDGFIGVIDILGMGRESQNPEKNCQNAIHKQAIQ